MATPVDLAPFVDKPCALLTDEEAKSFGFREPANVRTSAATGEPVECNRAGSANNTLSLSFGLGRTSDYLDRVYESDGWTYFVEVTVGGLPAVVLSRTENPPTGYCNIVIAAGPDQFVDMHVIGVAGGPDVCERARAAGEVIVNRLRAG